MTTPIEEMYRRIEPLVEKMKAKYPPELNMEGLEPALTNDIAEVVLEVLEEDLRVERQFILNILDGIDIADKQLGNSGGGTKAIRFALQNRALLKKSAQKRIKRLCFETPREKIGQLLVKWNMPTKQAFINDLVDLFS